MPACSYCGNDVAPDADACPKCGGKEKVYETPDMVSEDTRDAPVGIGGWLILVTFGVFISPILMAVQLVPLLEVFEAETWDLLTTPGTDTFVPYFSAVMTIELIVNSLLIMGHIYLVYLLIKRRRNFPRFFIGIMVFTLVFLVVDALLVSMVFPDEPVLDSDTLKDISRQLIGTCIWVPYMLKSRRVKATFTQ